MKNHNLIHIFVFVIIATFSISTISQAQTVTCPVGYTCTLISVQPVNCPAGFVCTPINTTEPQSSISSPNIPIQNIPQCKTFSTNLDIGNSGTNTAELQTQLISKGFDIPAITSGVASKGYFGSQTVVALKKYQQSMNLSSTGIFDSSTREKINSLISTQNGCVLPPTETISEQVKCVFNGATTEQKCNGTGKPIIRNDGVELFAPEFKCSGVGSCVANISISQTARDMELTWTSSCGQDSRTRPVTKIDGNDEYVNFNCGTGSNLPPVINGLEAPTTLSVGQMGTWAVKAYDPENGQLSYSVIWGDESSYAVNMGTMMSPQVLQTSTFTHSYSSAGVYTVNVTVKDNAGLTSQTSATVNVGNISSTNNPPKIVGIPAIQTGIQPGQTVNISLSAKDLDNDDLFWTVSWGDNLDMTQTGVCNSVRRQTGTGWNYSANHAWANAGTYKVKVTVNDCVGGSDSYLFNVTVGAVTAPSISVSSPNGGESWLVGTPQMIKWQDSTPTPVCPSGMFCEAEPPRTYDIWLMLIPPTCMPDSNCILGTPSYTIALNAPGSTYLWATGKVYSGAVNMTTLLPSSYEAVPAGSYTIKICSRSGSKSGSDSCDSSDAYFRIVSN